MSNFANNYEYSENFTGAGNGATHDIRTNPCNAYAIQAVQNGGTALSWTVYLEGSLDGTNFTPMLTHIFTTLGNGAVLYGGSNLYPNHFIRVRIGALSLGTATSITVYVAGQG